MLRYQNLEKLVMFLVNLRAFLAPANCCFTQKLGNSSVLYHKTKNPLILTEDLYK